MDGLNSCKTALGSTKAIHCTLVHFKSKKDFPIHEKKWKKGGKEKEKEK